MSVSVEVSPAVLGWAENRAANRAALRVKFPRLEQWKRGEAKPTYAQLEKLAVATNTPIGLLFLETPPVDQLHVTDFRTMDGGHPPTPSPDLLDTIADCERRQEWYRSYLVSEGHEPLGFVGSVTTEDDPVEAAAAMHAELEFSVNDRPSTWTDALVALIDSAEEAGVPVMVNGVVGSNTHRKLNPKEFRGFALVDDLAPVVFINGADTKAAQIFTLAHELAHIWLGVSGVDDVDVTHRQTSTIEIWCNAVAAEFLVPADEFETDYEMGADLTPELERQARIFKVSTLVILGRLRDTGVLDWQEYLEAFDAELARVLTLGGKGDGGNYHNTQPRRVSKTVAQAVLERTMSGAITYGESFDLLGTRNPATVRAMAKRAGVG